MSASESDYIECPMCRGTRWITVQKSKRWGRLILTAVVRCFQCGGNGFITRNAPILTQEEIDALAKKVKYH